MASGGSTDHGGLLKRPNLENKPSWTFCHCQGDCAAGQHAGSQSLLKLQVAGHHRLTLLRNYVFPGPQQPSAIPVIAEASLVLSLSTTQARLCSSVFLTSPLYICLPKWHCTLQCVTKNISLPETGLHANTHCDEPLACFKAFGF